jgi:nitrogen fixation NifU-like protein
MSDSLDDFAEQMQQEIFEQTKRVYGEEAFARWQNPRYLGKMDNASTSGRVTGTCGDTMEVYLRIEDERIVDASFCTDGCGTSMVCASVAVELAMGKDLDEAAGITGDSVLAFLGGLPEEDRHCAFLAAATVQEAIHNWITLGLAGKDPRKEGHP